MKYQKTEEDLFYELQWKPTIWEIIDNANYRRRMLWHPITSSSKNWMKSEKLLRDKRRLIALKRHEWILE